MREIAASRRYGPDDHLLLKEYTHRVNNEFAAAISFVSLTAARSSSRQVKSALGEIEKQLQNYAKVHRCLTMPARVTRTDASAHLRSLCQAISLARLESKDIELQFIECPLPMDSDRCWLLCLIVSELITNSARHAFGEGGGKIWVEVLPCGATIQCRVADNGKCAVPVQPGRGRAIIEALAARLDGKIEQHFGERGALSVLTFPADRAAHAPLLRPALSQTRVAYAR